MKRVLIVDDETSFLLSLRDGLDVNRKDFKVLTAENGREAISVLRTVPIDLLVTDLHLPVMNGFELLAWVSRTQPSLPVIVMTAFGTAEIETRLMKMNALQYLEKPLDLQMLREGIYTGLKGGSKSYIRGITLATFLQLVGAEQKNCTLKVSLGGRHGYLYIRRGELIDAEYDELQGEEAAIEIVTWDKAEIEMDGICRRQQQEINLSMEHLLIEAFRRKDEQQDKEKTKPEQIESSEPRDMGGKSFAEEKQTEKFISVPLESVDELTRKRLQQVLKKQAAVQEYAIFDQKSFLEEKSSEKCSIAEFDPTSFTQLVEQIDSQLNLGSFCSMEFRTSSRYRYLLFSCQQHRVLTKLKPGTQPQIVMKNIKSYVNR